MRNGPIGDVVRVKRQHPRAPNGAQPPNRMTGPGARIRVVDGQRSMKREVGTVQALERYAARRRLDALFNRTNIASIPLVWLRRRHASNNGAPRGIERTARGANRDAQ